MRTTVILLAVILVCFQAVASETGAEKAEKCTTCHNTMVNLKGRGAETIVSQTKNIRAGKKAHPPGLAELSDEDINEIATYLDSK